MKHLFKRGRKFYFRVAISRRLQEASNPQHLEICIALHTDSCYDACILVKLLSDEFTLYLHQIESESMNIDVDKAKQIKRRLERFLNKSLKRFLYTNQRRHTTSSESPICSLPEINSSTPTSHLPQIFNHMDDSIYSKDVTRETEMLLYSIIEKYISENNAKNVWQKKKSKTESFAQLGLIKDYFLNVNIRTIKRDDCVNFCNDLRRLPSNRKKIKRYRSYSVLTTRCALQI